MKVMTTQC